VGRYEDGTDSVPKYWHIKCRSRGITQKEAYNMVSIVKEVLNARFAAEFTYMLVVTSSPYCNNYIASIGRELLYKEPTRCNLGSIVY
jgi:hypothetical protein